MSHLLDANALIALAWPAHEHHAIMLRWFERHAASGWSTNALTQGAFVRVVSQPAFAGRSLAIAEVADSLLRNVAHTKHRFLALDFGFEEVLGICSGGILGHRQITDAWLLACAVRHQAKLVTFDAGIEQLLAKPAERQKHIALLKG